MQTLALCVVSRHCVAVRGGDNRSLQHRGWNSTWSALPGLAAVFPFVCGHWAGAHEKSVQAPLLPRVRGHQLRETQLKGVGSVFCCGNSLATRSAPMSRSMTAVDREAVDRLLDKLGELTAQRQRALA